jgi:hypothetical protein
MSNIVLLVPYKSRNIVFDDQNFNQILSMQILTVVTSVLMLEEEKQEDQQQQMPLKFFFYQKVDEVVVMVSHWPRDIYGIKVVAVA